MEKTIGTTIEDQMSNLILEGLDLNKFFSIDIKSEGSRLLSYYDEKLEKYLLDKNFIQKDFIYKDNDENIELQNESGSIKVVLFKTCFTQK